MKITLIIILMNTLMLTALTARAEYTCTLHDGEILTIDDITFLSQEYIEENNLTDTDVSTEVDDFIKELCVD